MKFHTIRIDEDVLDYLKGHAIPYEDKEPNDTLRRLLLNTKPADHGRAQNQPGVQSYLPHALQEILEVYKLVRNGMDRISATHIVARQRKIAYQTVVDKYARQLEKRTDEIDRLMRTEMANDFRAILKNKFPRHAHEIDNFFQKLESQ